MANFVDSKIAEATQLSTQVIPARVAAGCGYDEYRNIRMKLNETIISAIFGAEIGTKNNGKSTIKFNHSLPSNDQILQLVTIVNTFKASVEDPYLDKLESMIQDPNSLLKMQAQRVVQLPVYDKVKVKDVKDSILNGSTSSIMAVLFDGMQVLELAAMAENVKKIINRNRILIIGGITLAVATAAGIGIYAYNKHKKDEIDEIPEIGPDDAPELEVDDGDDVQVVEF